MNNDELMAVDDATRNKYRVEWTAARDELQKLRLLERASVSAAAAPVVVAPRYPASIPSPELSPPLPQATGHQPNRRAQCERSFRPKWGPYLGPGRVQLVNGPFYGMNNDELMVVDDATRNKYRVEWTAARDELQRLRRILERESASAAAVVPPELSPPLPQATRQQPKQQQTAAQLPPTFCS
jgi:hypothetical protein